jgi:peroxiredoxin Q/BCP
MIEQGDGLPAVELEGAEGSFTLSDRKGPLLLYFYPKDDTAGCTREAQDFSALLLEFKALGVESSRRFEGQRGEAQEVRRQI